MLLRFSSQACNWIIPVRSRDRKNEQKLIITFLAMPCNECENVQISLKVFENDRCHFQSTHTDRHSIFYFVFVIQKVIAPYIRNGVSVVVNPPKCFWVSVRMVVAMWRATHQRWRCQIIFMRIHASRMPWRWWWGSGYRWWRRYFCSWHRCWGRWSRCWRHWMPCRWICMSIAYYWRCGTGWGGTWSIFTWLIVIRWWRA